jgi:hypothetical protein
MAQIKEEAATIFFPQIDKSIYKAPSWELDNSGSNPTHISNQLTEGNESLLFMEYLLQRQPFFFLSIRCQAATKSVHRRYGLAISSRRFCLLSLLFCSPSSDFLPFFPLVSFPPSAFPTSSSSSSLLFDSWPPQSPGSQVFSPVTR